MDQPAVRDEQGVRDDAARLKPLPARRSAVATSPSASPPVVTGSRFLVAALIAVITRALARLIAFAVYYEGGPWTARLLGGLGAALTCVCCALTGHEATHGFAAQLAVVLHVLAGSVWLGGLVALGITLRARRRTSDLIGGAVV